MPHKECVPSGIICTCGFTMCPGAYMTLHLPHIAHSTDAIYSVYNFGKYNIFHRSDDAMLKTCRKLVCTWKCFLFMRTLQNLLLFINSQVLFVSNFLKRGLFLNSGKYSCHIEAWYSLEQYIGLKEDKLSSTTVDFIRSEGNLETKHLYWFSKPKMC